MGWGQAHESASQTQKFTDPYLAQRRTAPPAITSADVCRCNICPHCGKPRVSLPSFPNWPYVGDQVGPKVTYG
jgi:hypothetical protein